MIELKIWQRPHFGVSGECNKWQNPHFGKSGDSVKWQRPHIKRDEQVIQSDSKGGKQ